MSAERAERLVALLPDAHVDMILVTDLVNVRYVSGYTGSNGLALIGPQTRTFITDFRYVEQAAQEVDPTFDRVRAQLDLLDSIAERLPAGQLRLGFDDAHVSVRSRDRLRELLEERIELVGAGGLVERLRAVKDSSEIERIRAAAALADASFRRLIEVGLVGHSERDLALALEQDMRGHGARRPSFDAIVAGGPHGALPHAEPREAPIERGQFVVIDWGAELDGYCSDCTRTVATGDPGDEARRIYDLVLEAQLAGLQAVKAGANGRDVDGVARGLIDHAGHAEHFGHGLGHGVGLAVHEAPRLSQRSEDDLVAGNIVTVEPGIYLPGQFGVRIEDLVAVTADGCDILTSVTKDLIVLD